MKGFAFLSGLISGFLTFGTLPASSQVISDGTTNTNVNQIGNNFNILNGIQKGNNLFHSFKEFSIPTGSSATFQNSSAIENIINRVTGGNISNIDGLIKANGSASVFLINPSGIVFGENARLDIGGSFLGTTAESILFEDGFNYSAIDSEQTPLLTISVPLGLQMGSNPGNITIKGSGHNINAADPVFSSYVVEQPNSELKVETGNTIALVGGDITLEGGVLTAESGRIDLTAIGNNQASTTVVNLSNTSGGWSVDSVDLQQLGDISLTQESLIDASGTGSIQLQGRNISFNDGSMALIQNTTSNAAGDITIRAAGILQLDGMSANAEIRSGLENQALGTGNAGGIQVMASDVMINDGAAILTRSFSSGRAGDIVVNASGKIKAQGFSLLNPGSNANSIIGSLIFGTGDSGNVEVSARQLTLIDAGNITTATFGEGNAGQLRADIKNSIEISGLHPVTGSVSALASISLGAGNAGNSNISTGQLLLSNNARITMGGFATGDAGNVVVNASEFIKISGERTSIDSSVDILPELTRAFFGLPDIPTGNAGSVTIHTPFLRLKDKGAVSVRNEGIGNAGDLEINSDSLVLNQEGAITAFTTTGTGGNVFLNLQDSLIMRRGSLIDTESLSNGNGGNITINSPIIAGFENSDIIANAVEGNGGNINITTQGIFGLKFRDRLTPDSDITASSEFGINGTVEINNISIDPNSGLIELPTEVTDPSQQIANGCSSNNDSSFVATGRGGMPQNPTESVDVNPTWSDIRDLSAFRQQRNNSTAEIIQKSNQPAIVEATGFIRNEDGVIELVALENIPLRNKQVSECSGTHM
ncbi:MAG: filamentous hemagglutinin N-terminal domain-containing protein [Cyanobacteria bacterium J06633_8]